MTLIQQGYFTPTPFTNLTSQPSKNITFCSNQTTFFSFDPGAVIQNELKPGVKLTDLNWPTAIENGVHAVKGATDVIFVLYLAGAIATGMALIAALVGVREVFRYSAMICSMLSSVRHPQVFHGLSHLAKLLQLAFGCLLLASSIATILISKVVDVLNKHGNDIGIYAYKGETFIAMTWAATLLTLIAGFYWMWEFIRERRGGAFLGKGGGYVEE